VPPSLSALIEQLKQKLASQYFRKIGWLGIAELVNRVFRLGTTVTLARVFTDADYGLTAIIYTVFEISSVLTLRQGVGGKIIHTEAENLEDVCNTAYWINWLLCIVIFLLQGLAAFPIAKVMQNDQLILPLWMIASIYLMFPLFMVHNALVTREHRLQVIAICNVAQSLVTNVVTIVMALLGFGIWAIVAGMFFSTPVWIVVHWWGHPWRPPRTISFKEWRSVVNYGKQLLAVELLQKLRASLDYLIIAPIWGDKLLGVYFFAYSAGSGITTNIVQMLITPLFSKFCEARVDPQWLRKRYIDSLKLITVVIGGMVLVQSALAPFYVPIIFGQKWVQAVPLLVLICGSVLPRAYGWAAAALLNAQDRTHITLMTDVGFTILFALALFWAVQYGIFWVAVAVLLTHVLLLIPLTFWVDRYSFRLTKQ
jgi:O-antigen/teichoic acid export membrane protein